VPFGNWCSIVAAKTEIPPEFRVAILRHRYQDKRRIAIHSANSKAGETTNKTDLAHIREHCYSVYSCIYWKQICLAYAIKRLFTYLFSIKHVQNTYGTTDLPALPMGHVAIIWAICVKDANAADRSELTSLSITSELVFSASCDNVSRSSPFYSCICWSRPKYSAKAQIFSRCSSFIKAAEGLKMSLATH